MAQKTIHEIGSRPNATPVTAALMAALTGMWYAIVASTSVTAKPTKPATHAGFLTTPSRIKRVRIGRAASVTESAKHALRGSMFDSRSL